MNHKRKRCNDNKNRLLIGLDTDDKDINDYLKQSLSDLNLDNYDLEIILMTNNKEISVDSFRVKKYYGKKFDEFFQTSDSKYFIILIDNKNKIKFYQKKLLPSVYNLRLLINRFSDETNNS